MTKSTKRFIRLILFFCTVIFGFSTKLKANDINTEPKFKSIIIDAHNTGIELVKTTNCDISYEYLGVDNKLYYEFSKNLNADIMEISIFNNDPSFGTVNFAQDYKDYKNVVKLNIPDYSYTNFDITLNSAPIKMEDFNAPIEINGKRSIITIKDSTISKGTYNIDNEAGNITIEADTITKDINIANYGSVFINFNQKPDNLYIDLTKCINVKIPDGWSTNITTIGDGMPKIIIDNYGKTTIEQPN